MPKYQNGNIVCVYCGEEMKYTGKLRSDEKAICVCSGKYDGNEIFTHSKYPQLQYVGSGHGMAKVTGTCVPNAKWRETVYF